MEIQTRLRIILKSYDRIGFGRRGVLDAERELRRFASGLSADDHAHLRRTVVSWIDATEAERETARLHYNLPEHLQALAIRLCASLPIPESLPILRRLRAEGAFATNDARLCRETLGESMAILENEFGSKPASG